MSTCSSGLCSGYVGFGTPIENPIRYNFLDSSIKKITLSAISILRAIFPRTRSFCDRMSYQARTYRHDIAFIPSIAAPKDAPKLGEFSHADVKVVTSMNESFEWKKELIQSAKTSIEWSFNYAGGKKFREILRLIQTQMQENKELRVHLLLSEDCLEEEDLRLLRELASNDGRFVYLVTGQVPRVRPFVHIEENHVKLLCIDGKYFVMGGSGVTDKMTDNPAPPNRQESARARLMAPAIRDTDLVGKGVVTQTMRREFFSLFGKWEKRATGRNIDRFFHVDVLQPGVCQRFEEESSIVKGVKLKYVVGGPEHYSCNPITYEITSGIYKARKVIRIANFILNPSRPIRVALRSKRGHVRILGQTLGCKINRSICFLWHAFLNRNNANLFDRFFEFDKRGVMYHKKVAIFDNKTVIIGSYNLGFKSPYCDDENICVIEDERVAQEVDRALDSDLKDCEEINPRSISVRAYGFIGKIIRRAFATLNG